MHAFFSLAVLIAISTQSIGASLAGLYRIQTTNGQELILTGQGDNKPPKFEKPSGAGTQIWQFEDQGDGTTLIQNLPTHEYIDCRSGSCLESNNAQRFHVEPRSANANRYVFRDLSQQKALRLAAQNGVELADSNGSDAGFDVIRVEFYTQNPQRHEKRGVSVRQWVKAEQEFERSDPVIGYNILNVSKTRAEAIVTPGPMLHPISGPSSINETNHWQFAIRTADVLISGLISPQLVVNTIGENFPLLTSRVPEGSKSQILPPGVYPTGWDMKVSIYILAKGTKSGRWNYVDLKTSIVDAVNSMLSTGVM
ncbi:NAD dependent epimerase/dehydratase [Penicillium angulare]|uniref:NAD dependent epimerase/dehydratase n=1 Tax=Penicillium angulare TaxID=116970 RepID=A0A9W9EKD9_9EURO|nr:NAD dependent epimerase/dehydratase [Penicillium angulare]